MSLLPRIGSIIELFGVGCEGCGHLHGRFKVESVQDAGITRIVAKPHEVDREGVVKRRSLVSLVVEWDRDLECWLTDCNGSAMVVNIGGHFRGPSMAAA